jgi:OmpA-OmpF porin, OOP family
MRFVVSALLLSIAIVASPAGAQTAHSSEEIVEFFAGSGALGASRGICVGTEEECASKADEPPRAGLDMLINFELDSAELTPDAQAKLDQFAKALTDNRLKPHRFVVEGHTDAYGSENYNLSLSERRANSVISFLLERGIEEGRITAQGKGMAEPRVSDPYAPVNRRVEMKIALSISCKTAVLYRSNSGEVCIVCGWAATTTF